MGNFSTHKIKKTFRSNSQVLKNMTWLSVLQFANYLIPLFILPYVTRTIGAEFLGKVVYAQGIISYFTVVVSYGFEYSATRDIALNRGSKETIRHIFWGVIRYKILFLVLSFLGLCLFSLFFSKISTDIKLYAYCFLINVGIAFFPTWFFQGVEKMGLMSIFNFLIKALGAVLTVLLIKNATQYRLYALIPSVSYIVCGVIAFFYVIKVFDLGFWEQNKAISKMVFRNGFPVFLNNFFVCLYTTANITILGLYASDSDLGYYSGAYKIIVAVNTFVTLPISMAIFPKMSTCFAKSKELGLLYLKRILLIFGGISIVISIFTVLLSPCFVQIMLGKEFLASIPLLKCLSITTPLVVVATLLTVQGLYGMGLQRFAPLMGLVLSAFSIILNFILIPDLGSYGAAYSWIFTQILEIIIAGSIIIFYSKKTTRNHQNQF